MPGKVQPQSNIVRLRAWKLCPKCPGFRRMDGSQKPDRSVVALSDS